MIVAADQFVLRLLVAGTAATFLAVAIAQMSLEVRFGDVVAARQGFYLGALDLDIGNDPMCLDRATIRREVAGCRQLDGAGFLSACWREQ